MKTIHYTARCAALFAAVALAPACLMAQMDSPATSPTSSATAGPAGAALARSDRTFFKKAVAEDLQKSLQS